MPGNHSLDILVPGTCRLYWTVTVGWGGVGWGGVGWGNIPLH